jgi:hypothetical protein
LKLFDIGLQFDEFLEFVSEFRLALHFVRQERVAAPLLAQRAFAPTQRNSLVWVRVGGFDERFGTGVVVNVSTAKLDAGCGAERFETNAAVIVGALMQQFYTRTGVLPV